MALYRGFKSHATRIADGFRAELSIGELDRFRPFDAAEHLGISVRALSDCAGGVFTEENHQTLRDSGVFSAITVFHPETLERRIIFNDSRSPERIASDLAHELSHTMLEHPARAPLDALTGCRSVDRDHEDQAGFLAGALLITERAAIVALTSGTTLETMAKRFGISVAMLQYRINVTGARRRIAARARSSGAPTRRGTSRV